MLQQCTLDGLERTLETACTKNLIQLIYDMVLPNIGPNDLYFLHLFPSHSCCAIPTALVYLILDELPPFLSPSLVIVEDWIGI